MALDKNFLRKVGKKWNCLGMTSKNTDMRVLWYHFRTRGNYKSGLIEPPTQYHTWKLKDKHDGAVWMGKGWGGEIANAQWMLL